MSIYATNGDPASLEEQRIWKAIQQLQEWITGCDCEPGKYCESYGCDSLREIIAILKGEVKP